MASLSDWLRTSILLKHLILFVISSPFVFSLPRPALPRNRTEHTVVDTLELIVGDFSTSAFAAPVLIDDVDLDGHLDLYFATVDGQLHGIPSFSQCALQSDCARLHWSTHIRGEHFVSTAAVIPVESVGQSLVLFVSDHGTLFLVDHIGNVVAQVKIPAVFVARSVLFDQRYWLDPVHLASKLHWDFDSELTDNNSDFYHFRPRVYASPVILSTTTSRVPPDENSDTVSVIISVSFEAIDSGHLLAALVGFSQRSLLSSSLWGFSTTSRRTSPVIVPLQLGRVGISPPYLLANPLLVSNAQLSSVNPQRTWHPGFALLVTVSNGYLFGVSLPLGAQTSHVQLLWSDLSKTNEYAHPCVIVNYTPSHLGCLLIDNFSHLRMIDISPLKNGHTRSVADRLLWHYGPPMVPINSSVQQLGQVTIVSEAACYDDAKRKCSLWAIFPDSVGRIHAVDIQSGQSVPHFPIQVHDFANSPPMFAAGPGILYKSADSVTWLLFSDTVGCFYHLRLDHTPVVLHANQTCTAQSAFNEVTHWLTPIPVTQYQLQPTGRQPLSQSELLSLVVAFNGRVVILKTTPRTISRNTSSVHKPFLPHHMFKYDSFDVHFLNPDGRPTDVIHLHPDQEVIHYVIRGCPLKANYLVQLLDFSGTPISEWSNPKSSTSIRSMLSSHLDCSGSLSISQPPSEGPFKSRIYLHALELDTGRLLHTPYRLTPQQQFTASVLVEIHTFWPQLIVLWTYIIFIFFLMGLVIVSFGTSFLRNGRAHAV